MDIDKRWGKRREGEMETNFVFQASSLAVLEPPEKIFGRVASDAEALDCESFELLGGLGSGE